VKKERGHVTDFGVTYIRGIVIFEKGGEIGSERSGSVAQRRAEWEHCIEKSSCSRV